MKYLLHTIWHFLAKIPHAVRNRLTSRQQESHPAIEALSQIAPHIHARPMPVFRRKKRKSFGSFLREQSLSSRRRQRALSRSRIKSRKELRHRHPKKGNFQLSASSIDDHSKDLFTNELQPECSAVFEDNNGLQISAIASMHTQKEDQNRLDESDEELMRLLQATQVNAAPEGLQFKPKRENSRRGNGKAWWENQIDNFRKQLYKNMNPSAGALDFGEEHLKILTLLDLSQECPKIFHMPLSLHYS